MQLSNIILAYITISGGGDSFYEYLLKTHILMDGDEELQLDMWQTAVESMYNYLRSVANDGSVYLSQDVYGYRILKTGELVKSTKKKLKLSVYIY